MASDETSPELQRGSIFRMYEIPFHPRALDLFLVYIVISCALAIFFLLYFNRVFSSVVSWAIRGWTKRRYGIYIEIQALQISLLGGRIFFTGFRYHGNNETILIQNGHITWSYWLRRVRHVELAGKNAADKERPGESVGGNGKEARLPCRINVSVSGLEWFVYNRSAAYDTVLAGMIREDPPLDALPDPEIDMHAKLRKRRSNDAEKPNGAIFGDGTNPTPHGEKHRRPSLSSEGEHTLSSQDGRHHTNSGPEAETNDIPLMLRLFPIHVDCQKAALVMGNENTKGVLIIKTKGLRGEISASATDTPDPYRQLFDLQFEDPVVEMRDNEDFREEQADRAAREQRIARETEPPPRKSYFRRQRRKIYGQLRNLVPYWRRSVESLSSSTSSAPRTAATQVPGSNHWQGLSRYLDDYDQDERTRWSSVEYAALKTIVESPRAILSIYWDAAGKIPAQNSASGSSKHAKPCNINGAQPPAWGIRLSVQGGTVNYGPWADRHRADLQRVFFPGLCKDASPAQELLPGSYRVPTKFELYVELSEEVTLRVPTREVSKNWRWKGQEAENKNRRVRDKRKSRNLFKKSDPAPNAAHQRPYGWLDIKVAANATISYSMDMVAGAEGYSNSLNLDLPSTEISTSVNQQPLWRSGAQNISCDLSTPLKWNGLREWHFGIDSKDLELFILRDHVFLLIDLVDDWSSGPPTEYLVFTPFKYHLDLKLQNIRLFLNVNDANIINDPTSSDDNIFVVISSPVLESRTCIPIDQFRPPKNMIPFDVRAEKAEIDLQVPPWNTQHAFLTSKHIGHLENLVVSGQYHYNATTSPANTDTLVLDVTGQSPEANLHGFVVRYFLKIKDNYFGDDVHFRTLDEYQEFLRLKQTDPEAEVASRPPHKKSNDLDVILSIRADDPKILLPTNLYSAKDHVQGDAASLSVDLRFTNYYMDLELMVSPLSLSFGNTERGMETPFSATSSTQLFIDGLRVYGHRVFGLPPTEPTYLCNWDLAVGAVTGECTADFLSALARAGRAFAFTFDDDENALISYSSIVFYDVTFLRVSVDTIQLWIHLGEAAFLCSTAAIDINYNDWARTHYSKRANVSIPDLQLSCVNSESAIRHKARAQHPVQTDAFFKTSIQMAMIGRKLEFSQERKLQQELVRRHDQRTHRTPFLILPELLDPPTPIAIDPPAQAAPPIPQPINSTHLGDESVSVASQNVSAKRPRALRHKTSFISIASTSKSSLRQTYGSFQHRSTENTEDQHTIHGRRGDEERSFELGTGVSGRAQLFAMDNATTRTMERRDPVHNTVAFSSPYFAPYFPLENVVPDTTEATMQSIERDSGESVEKTTPGFNLEDIDPDRLDEHATYSSLIIEMNPGITGFLNPTSVTHIANLISALKPYEPDDVLDAIQLDAMTDIFALQKEQKAKGTVNDLTLRLPQVNVRFLNSSDTESPDPCEEEQDQYDLALSGIALATRTEKQWADEHRHASRKSRQSFHLRVGSVIVKASERLLNMDSPQAAFTCRLGDIMVSMGSRDLTYLDAEIGYVQGHMASEKIEYLASLIHRTNVLASNLEKTLSGTLSEGGRVNKFLTYTLVKQGQEIADPSFLVRPSAVLRSATKHLRTYDSWKLAMRIRQLWAVASESRKEQLVMHCRARVQNSPEDARQQVTAAFQRWRNWDLEDLSKSLLLNNVFGKLKGMANVETDMPPFMAVLRVKESQLALDPGPKQNEITILDLTARFQSNASNASVNTSPSIPTAVLNVYCSDATVGLNWELCELVDDVLKLYKRMQPASSTATTEMQPGKATKPKETAPKALHIVLALGQGSVILDTINLNARSMSSDLKISLLLQNGANSDQVSNLIISCDAVSSRIKSHSQVLSMFQLRGPSVFVSHELQTSERIPTHTVKATASSRELTLAIKQDPLILMEVADLLIKDEVAQLYALKHALPSSPAVAKPVNNGIKASQAIYRINAALFLDEYTISIPLLRSLEYTISGVVARASMAANVGKEIIFDFDVKENSHEMEISTNNSRRSISLLQIPPTNGRVTSRMGQAEHSINIFASLELVQLDASAVYSLLSALNRPEISNAINDAQHQMRVMEEHISEIFGSDRQVQPQAAQAPTNPLVYGIHLTFAGLRIFGNSPLKSAREPLAYLSFRLDSVHLAVSNRVENRGPTLENPEIHVNLGQIALEIQKGTSEVMNTCGSLAFGALITATSRLTDDGKEGRLFNVRSDEFNVALSPQTIATVVDISGYMSDKIKDLDTSRELEYLRKLRQSKPRIAINDQEEVEEPDVIDSFLSSITYSFEIRSIRTIWSCGLGPDSAVAGQEDLVVSLHRIELATRTRNSARLTIENLQVEMAPPSQDRKIRSANSALLPEVIFNIGYVATTETRRLAFQAVGKSLDLRLTSGFIIPAANLRDSIKLSIKNARTASQHWNPSDLSKPQNPSATPGTAKPDETRQKSIWGSRRTESLLIDADFAGAVVHLTGRRATEEHSSRASAPGHGGKYGQFSTDESGNSTVLKSPGLAFKMEYRDYGKEDPSVYAEVMLDASTNILYPSVVPLVMDITSSIKEVVRDDESDEPLVQPSPIEKSSQGDNILTTDPSAVLGRTKLNLGLRICRQEFSLSCQPIARVAATASFDDVYFTMNTVRSADQGNFFAISGTFSRLQASVQHVYSRESTANFDVDSIVLSLMNSKHVSGTSGVSAIVKVSPMRISVNAKQVQDFLLFREIWIPRDVRHSSTAPVAKLVSETSQGHLVQRYQQVAATAAFPWTATISISALEINVDLGQAIGKSVFAITDFWVSSKKTSDWEQNLCLGFERIGIDSTGRMSGFVALEDFKLRTVIQWPKREEALNETPLIQASLAFSQLRVKIAFDYQAFLVADITSMEFLMYNVRRGREGQGDRLVASFEGDAVQVFGTTTSAAQTVALYQAFQKLVQERKANFASSLKEIEKFMRRRTSTAAETKRVLSMGQASDDEALAKSPISLDTDVVVTLKALNLGVFPNTFFDHQVFKMEALNAQARFSASIDQRRIHSTLGLTLGQLRIGLAGVRHIEAPKSLSELTVEDVVRSATGSRGGTILKVPKVEAVMQTWQTPDSRKIDYIFKSAFEGKVEVGWNYSRISYIRGMWANHYKMLEQTWGRRLPLSAIKVTGVPEPNEEGKDGEAGTSQTKITAEVHVPLSKYEYRALEPPVIETPQLRDMGEATPPLEWIGLHRDRLPNLTHQIVIVSLLELAGEVEDAYSKILGSS
ncbi:uncharacterized protein E0L32_010740 [Thyridium curvatum]|uniref:Fermentation associated protein n=1 Tax=Thyridium curvatum TaxID=1093900 RepID=A0A507AR14_9PEZI|nr:uncharacterized protein E0L32_010740 [Thyridium curvatum]TPX07318.1 hypothetical protein E0L32_010740 [Thyridium curvatum]